VANRGPQATGTDPCWAHCTESLAGGRSEQRREEQLCRRTRVTSTDKNGARSRWAFAAQPQQQPGLHWITAGGVRSRRRRAVRPERSWSIWRLSQSRLGHPDHGASLPDGDWGDLGCQGPGSGIWQGVIRKRFGNSGKPMVHEGLLKKPSLHRTEVSGAAQKPVCDWGELVGSTPRIFSRPQFELG
jgi:hypothetical protein